MKTKSGYICRKVAEQNIVIPIKSTERDITVIVHLNDTGRFLWDLMAQDISVEELTSALSERYEIDENVARNDVTSFICVLRNADLIED